MKRVESMLSIFGKVTIGIMLATAIYIPIFYGRKAIYSEILWQILGLSAVCALGSIILPLEDGESREVSKMTMLVRSILYYIYNNLVVLGLGFRFRWFTFRNGFQVLGMEIAIVGVFIGIYSYCYYMQYQEAKRMNEKLKEKLKEKEF